MRSNEVAKITSLRDWGGAVLAVRNGDLLAAQIQADQGIVPAEAPVSSLPIKPVEDQLKTYVLRQPWGRGLTSVVSAAAQALDSVPMGKKQGIEKQLAGRVLFGAVGSTVHRDYDFFDHPHQMGYVTLHYAAYEDSVSHLKTAESPHTPDIDYELEWYRSRGTPTVSIHSGGNFRGDAMLSEVDTASFQRVHNAQGTVTAVAGSGIEGIAPPTIHQYVTAPAQLAPASARLFALFHP